MGYYIALGIAALIIILFTTRFIFDLLLRGFAPIIPSRPWVVEEVMGELELPREDAVCLAFSTGRSGFFHALELHYPRARLLAIEPGLFPYLVSRVQAFFRKTRMEIIRKQPYRVDVSNADFIYCHLYPEGLRGMGKKFKFECKPNTVIISTGFNIPNLTSFKIVPLEDRKGRFDWLSKNQKLFQRKSQKYKKEKKAFFYKI